MTTETAAQLAATRSEIHELTAIEHPGARLRRARSEALQLERRLERERGEALAIKADPAWPKKVAAARKEVDRLEAEIAASTPWGNTSWLRQPGATVARARGWLQENDLDRQIKEQQRLRARVALRRLVEWPAKLLIQAETTYVKRAAPAAERPELIPFTPRPRVWERGSENIMKVDVREVQDHLVAKALGLEL